MKKINDYNNSINVLKNNYIIYFNCLLKVYVSNNRYEELGAFLSEILRYNTDKSIYQIPLSNWTSFRNICNNLRSRRFFWTEEIGIKDKKNHQKEILYIRNFVQKYQRKHKAVIDASIQFNQLTEEIVSLFKLDNTYKYLIQFLIDSRISRISNVYKDDFYVLFNTYDTKDIFKNDLYEILNVFVKDFSKDNLDRLIELGIFYQAANYKNNLVVNEEPEIATGGNGGDKAIYPYWPEIQQIYISLLRSNSLITFDNVLNYFKTSFKTKLEYDDFTFIDHTNIIQKLINGSLEKKQAGVNVLLYGMAGTGKTEMAYALAKKNNWKLVAVGDGENLNPFERLNNLKFAQNFFKNFKDEPVIFLFDEMEDLLNIDTKFLSKNQLNRVIENTPFPIFWTSNNVWRYDQSFLRRMTYAAKFDIPGKKRRKLIWEKFSKQHDLNLDQPTINQFSEAYDTVPSIIGNVSEVSGKAGLQQSETKTLIESLLTVYNHGEESIPKDDYTGNYDNFDFALANTDVDLKNLVNQLKKVNSVNFSACFHGAPGTGKSAFARYLAKELEIKVIYKKASDLLDKYLGGTEKKIAAAFKEAKEDEAMLIFDEADSLLQERAAAQRSWEVTQVNEMLTQMENSAFPFICTTNNMGNIDQASLRRFVFKIKFKWMSEEQIHLACKKFFDMSFRIPKHWQLSTGDFVSVKKRIDILGITDQTEIFDLLKQENELKKDSPKGFGFNSDL